MKGPVTPPDGGVTPPNHSPPNHSPPHNMESIIGAMDKLDKDIVLMDRVIKKVTTKISNQDDEVEQLKKVQVTPRCTEVNENVTLIQRIYAENKAKARQTNMSMLHLGCPLLQPGLPSVALYKQPSDLPQYHENIRRWKEGTFKKALVEYLWKKKQETSNKEKELAAEYNRKHVVWQEKLRLLQENPKRMKDLQQCRKYFEQVFPNIKRKLEQEERFNRARSGGNCVRSEAELAEIVEHLAEHQECEDKQVESVAPIPPMILNPIEKSRRFYNECGRTYTPHLEHKANMQIVNQIWTEDEKKLFKEKFGQFGKVFHKIVPHLPNKNIAQCIQYYYLSKKKENYKALLPKKRKKHIQAPKEMQPVLQPILSPATPRITRSKRVEQEGGAELGNKWLESEIETLKECLQKYGKNWARASKEVITKSSTQCKHYYQNHRKRLGLDNLLKQSTSDSIRQSGKTGNESDSDEFDFEVDLANAVQNGVDTSDPAVILNTLSKEFDLLESKEVVHSIATSLASSTLPDSSLLPPLEPHCSSDSAPRPTTPDVIAMVTSMSEECAPPPPPPLHNPAANPIVFSHRNLPQMPQIGAARLKDPATPPSMKRYPGPEEPVVEEPKAKQPESVTSDLIKGVEKLDKSKVTFKNLPRLTAKTVTTDEDSEEGLVMDNNGVLDGQAKRKYVQRQVRGNGEHPSKEEGDLKQPDEGLRVEGVRPLDSAVKDIGQFISGSTVKDVGQFISGLEPISSDEDPSKEKFNNLKLVRPNHNTKGYVTHTADAAKGYVTHTADAAKGYVTHTADAAKGYITHTADAAKGYVTHTAAPSAEPQLSAEPANADAAKGYAAHAAAHAAEPQPPAEPQPARPKLKDGDDYRGTVLSSKEVEDLLHEQCLQLTKGVNYIQSPDALEVHNAELREAHNAELREEEMRRKHVRKRQDSDAKVQLKEKGRCKKGQEKVDKKASALKVYDFDSSEDEPIAPKTEKPIKRPGGRAPPLGSHPLPPLGGPIAAHIKTTAAAAAAAAVEQSKTEQSTAHAAEQAGGGGSETDDADETEELRKVKSRPASSSSSSCDLPMYYDMSEEAAALQSKMREDKAALKKATILKHQQEHPKEPAKEPEHLHNNIAIQLHQHLNLKQDAIRMLQMQQKQQQQSMQQKQQPQHQPQQPPQHHSPIPQQMQQQLIQPGGHQQQPGGHQQQPGGHQQQPGGHQQPSGHQQQAGGHQQQPSGHQQQPGHHIPRNVMRLKVSSPKGAHQSTTASGMPVIPITSEMKTLAQQKAKINSGHGQDVLRRDASTGKYVQVRGIDMNRHMQHAPVRGVYTRESPVSRAHPSQSPGPRIVTHNESQRTGSAFSKFSAKGSEGGFKSVITPSEGQFKSRISPTEGPIDKRLAENRLAENRLAENRIAENRIAENRIAENRLAEVRALENSRLTDARLHEAVRSIAEQRQQAEARIAQESRSHGEARAQELARQIQASHLAAQSQSIGTKQFQQVLQQHQQMQLQANLSELSINPEMLMRSFQHLQQQQARQQSHFQSGEQEARQIEVARQLEALRKNAQQTLLAQAQEQVLSSNQGVYVPRYYVPPPGPLTVRGPGGGPEMIPIPQSMYSQRGEAEADNKK